MSAFMRLMNKFPAMLLRSPLYGLMSKRFLLLTFTGRKSGRSYTIPVAYLREDGTLLMTTDSAWWKNLRGGAPVTVRVGGRKYEAPGESVTDEAEVARVLETFLREQPSYGKYVGLEPGPGGSVDRADIERVARKRVVVWVRTDERGRS
jgi:deazaflavin-dependent oxidoreductase (nitroreductase family)